MANPKLTKCQNSGCPEKSNSLSWATTDENISTPLVINKNGKTVMYWDVADYPVPKDLVDDIGSLHRCIESILLYLGCHEVSIVAYVYKNRFSDEMERKFTDAKIFVDSLPEAEGGSIPGDDDFARMTWMLVDIICLPVVFPKPNVIIIISKHMEKEAVDCLKLLDCEKSQKEGILANSIDHPLDEDTNVSS
ncbi:unnamed protein product [Eruca vesicaria subsp. sativa]|uniref:NYN domain-containing protein n=1 Tax=Eruca vesicaria subsp. sativa TaxID=29727 RepID=A0ABC8JSH9_ERUVS|nr:unnamed protein product [Eruca vesicaria subsp. sativa]